MRRKDREIKGFDALIAVMRTCDVCHVAFADEFPHVVPMNFGLEVRESEKVSLYFHGAATGRKHDLIKKNNKVGFVMECTHGLVTGQRVGPCECSMEFECVMGTGTIHYVEPQDTEKSLRTLLEQYKVEEGPDYRFHDELVRKVTALRLDVISMTGKKRNVAEQPHKLPQLKNFGK